MISLYTDGGVILKNPSPYGGTWAYVLVDDEDELLQSDSGVITPNEMKTELVTNNQTELLAMICGLKAVFPKDSIHVYSDSGITLGRTFRNSSMKNIPIWMTNTLKSLRRLVDLKHTPYTLLAGHPTKKQLETGIGRNGHPVSKWNVMCDEMCKQEARIYLESIK